MLEICLLGRFELRVKGERIELPSRGAQTLCAYLLLNRDIRHRREKVAGYLWPDSDEQVARGKLRYALWQLRKAIGGRYILADKISIGFVSNSDYWLDVSFLEGTPAPRLSTQELWQSVSVYVGDLLPGFYEDWVVLERERFKSLFEHRMELLLMRLVEGGSWHKVVEISESWIAMGDAPEPGFQVLMVAHAYLGDVSKAASVYQRCVLALNEQLGVEPSIETRKIYEMISRGEKPHFPSVKHHLHPSAHEPPAFLESRKAPGEDKPTVFVAREQELAQLNDWLRQAISGNGSVAFIRGDAGRGKSALMREFCRLSLEQYHELIILHGSGEASTGLGDPHLLFRDTLSLLVGDIENKWAEGVVSSEAAQRLWNSLPQSIEALMDVGPDLIGSFVSGESILAWTATCASEGAEWLEKVERQVLLVRDRPAPVNIQHSDLQKGLFEQYTRVLFKLARQVPLLVVLDDLQWADLGSISLLFHLGRRIEGHHILIVGIYRADEVSKDWEGKPHPLLQVLAELKRKYGHIEIDLDHSDAELGRQFVDAFLDTEANKLDEKFRQALYRHTGGHPLFTVELLRQMQEQGHLQKDQSGSWVEGAALGWETLPAKVEAVIAGRVSRLPDHLRDIQCVASVEGEEFSAQVIAEVKGIEERAIVHQLSQELDKKHMLVEAIGIQRVGEQRLSRYRFRHHLFHQYIYNSLDPVERTHLHEAVGMALERLYGENARRISVHLAKHYEEAGLLEKTIDYLLSAGEIAKRQSANEEAIAHLSRGLALLEGRLEDPARMQKELELQIAISAPLVALKGYTAPEAEQAFERARVLCERLNDPGQLATVLWGLWSFYLVRANYQTAKKLAEQVLNLAQSNEDPNLQLIAHWTLGITLTHLGKFIEAIRHLDRAIEFYNSQVHQHLTFLYGQNPAATCFVYRAYILWFIGYADQALDSIRQALMLAEEIAHPYSLAFVHGMASGFFALRLEIEGALHHAEKALSLSREGGFPFLMALGLTMRGWARAMMGKTSMTSGQIQRGIDAMLTIGAELGYPIFLFFLAKAHAIAGEIEEALNVVQQAINVAHKNDEHLNESDLQRLKGELLELRMAPDDKIIDCFQKAVDIARHQHARSFELQAMISFYKFVKKRKGSDKMRNELAETYAWFTEGMDTVSLRKARQLLGLDH